MYFLASLTFATLALGTPQLATLRLKPTTAVEVVAERPELGFGAVRLRFGQPRPFEVDALGAAVVVLHGNVEPPAALVSSGQWLGGPSWRVPARLGETGLDVARRWLAHPAVASALPDLWLERRRRAVTFDDPRWPSQWYHELLDTERLFEQSLGDPGTRAVVIDSAVEITHPDLAAGIVEPYDAFDDDDDPSPEAGVYCPTGHSGVCDEHGTAVAGIIGARANNSEGIVGFCPACSLVPVRLLGDGMGALSADVAAFEHAIAANAAVINNSWGYVEALPVPEPLAAVIARAAREPRDGLGAVVVFAAGNDDRVLADDELCALPQVLCVSATDRYGRPSAYTNRGACVDLAAPSATMTTTVGGGYTETFGGTSAAAPVVAGLAAWVLAFRPELTAAEVSQLLVDTALPSPLVTHDERGHHQVYGFGEVSPAGILSALMPPAAEPQGSAGDEPPAGCACRLGSPNPSPDAALVGALVLAWLVVARRRRVSGARWRR